MEDEFIKNYKLKVIKNRIALLSSPIIALMGDRINNSVDLGYPIDWIFYIIWFCYIMYFALIHLKCPSCKDTIDSRMATKIELCPYCGTRLREKQYYY